MRLEFEFATQEPLRTHPPDENYESRPKPIPPLDQLTQVTSEPSLKHHGTPKTLDPERAACLHEAMPHAKPERAYEATHSDTEDLPSANDPASAKARATLPRALCNRKTNTQISGSRGGWDAWANYGFVTQDPLHTHPPDTNVTHLAHNHPAPSPLHTTHFATKH